jgi:hypothetical protein
MTVPFYTAGLATYSRQASQCVWAKAMLMTKGCLISGDNAKSAVPPASWCSKTPRHRSRKRHKRQRERTRHRGEDPQFFHPAIGFDHGVGHSLQLLYDAKAPTCKKINKFNALGHYSSNTVLDPF